MWREAIEIYQEIIRGNSNSFLAHLLTQAHWIKNCVSIGGTGLYFAKTVMPMSALKEADTSLSVVALSQFGALRRQMQNAGLGAVMYQAFSMAGWYSAASLLAAIFLFFYANPAAIR